VIVTNCVESNITIIVKRITEHRFTFSFLFYITLFVAWFWSTKSKKLCSHVDHGDLLKKGNLKCAWGLTSTIKEVATIGFFYAKFDADLGMIHTNQKPTSAVPSSRGLEVHIVAWSDYFPCFVASLTLYKRKLANDLKEHIPS
jgi:hypothetical protein